MGDGAMIDRQGPYIVVECDSCDETLRSEEHAEWAEFWSEAKREGWTSTKVGHDCPRCGRP